MYTLGHILYSVLAQVSTLLCFKPLQGYDKRAKSVSMSSKRNS